MNLRDHLVERRLDVNLYNGIEIVQSEGIVVFPIWNLSGQYIGFQQYRPSAAKEAKNHPKEGRYYTLLSGARKNKSLGMWGLETYHYHRDVLFIAEGIFDACRLHNTGMPAVALLNSSHKHYRSWLNSTGRKIIKVEDCDGSLLGPYPSLALPQYADDLGDVETDEEIVDAVMKLKGE